MADTTSQRFDSIKATIRASEDSVSLAQPKTDTTHSTQTTKVAEPPNIVKDIEWVRQNIGLVAAIVVLSLVILWQVWKNRKDIGELPGIGWLRRRLFQKPIPKADPNKFSVLIANLKNDTSGSNKSAIVHDLSKLKGVQLLQLDRDINPKHQDQAEEEKLGHSEANHYLERSGADILIWGTILEHDGKTLPKLYWTAKSNIAHGEKYPLTQNEFNLPEVFWSDLSNILSLLVIQASGELIKKRETMLLTNWNRSLNALSLS